MLEVEGTLEKELRPADPHAVLSTAQVCSQDGPSPSTMLVMSETHVPALQAYCLVGRHPASMESPEPAGNCDHLGGLDVSF